MTGINNAVDAIKKALTEKHRTIMFDLDLAVVQATPRKIGRAKGNWIASINRPHRGTTRQLERTNNTPAINDIKRPCVSYLSNNLPYIERLNEGWSDQAPAGYVEKAVNAVVRAHK